ncbi:hypothetical protein C9374_009992 [Naegleria lovaniensis]|uniref:Uncharacterized protein n=1 Tax=Naegleria lovaniensis TaxID=51637 RepID=A0AA88GHJ7_NAELO|nr:uncharacterized protein C9374_009992 [Naegleria lovaniensis]KAG2375369.1 hypothetical protein C9374_009992 [Naegleria lovaniensis]
MLYGFGANEYEVLKSSESLLLEFRNNINTNDDLFELTPLTLPSCNFQIRKIVANNEFATAMLTMDGKLFGSGKNVASMFGFNNEKYPSIKPFTWIGNGLQGLAIKNVAIGNRFILAQTLLGQLFVCGSFIGSSPLMECEVFTNLDPYVPTKLKNAGIEYIHARYTHCGVISRDGSLYVIGENGCGEFGLGHYFDRNKFTLVSSIPESVKSINFGYHNSVAIGESGFIYVAGSNLNGELGISNEEDSTVKVFRKIEIMNSENIEKIQKTACGMHHVLVLSERGHIYSTGANDFGQLGLNDFYNRYEFSIVMPQTTFRDVSCGDHFSVMMTLDGQILACGSNSNGAIGQWIHHNPISPTPILVDGQQLIASAKHQNQQPTSLVCGNRFTLCYHSAECFMDIILKEKQHMLQCLFEQLQQHQNMTTHLSPEITFHFSTR